MAIIGVDEVGRGPLAGTIVACALSCEDEDLLQRVDDSKALSEKKRDALFDDIIRASVYCLGEASVEEIDSINILQASMLAMKRAIEGIDVDIDKVLVDGNKAPDVIYPCETIIKGDALVPVIGAASIVAKVTRDRAMASLDEIYPGYGFAKHKGYGTKVHMEALRKLGPCPIHRTSFKPVRALLELHHD